MPMVSVLKISSAKKLEILQKNRDSFMSDVLSGKMKRGKRSTAGGRESGWGKEVG